MKTAILSAALLAAPLTAPLAAQVGELEYLDDTVAVPQAVEDKVAALLPELSNASAAFLSRDYSPNLVITEACEVSVVTIWDGAGFKNALGYFTYTEDPFTIVDRQLIFPNFSLVGLGGLLEVGDRSVLRDAAGAPRLFQPGERIGFFLVANGWNSDFEVQNWDPLTASLPFEDPQSNKARGVFTTVDAINPEVADGLASLSRHVALIAMDAVPGFLDDEPYFITGFEDLFRTASDDDFNDAIFVVETTPADAVDIGDIPPDPTGDIDGDGVVSADDHFPFDPDRALETSFPSAGWTGIGLEDLYPSLGDRDFNDAFLLYRYDVVTDAAGDVKDLMGTFHLAARGASFNHRLGLHLPDLPPTATGQVLVERWLSDDDSTHFVDDPLSLADVVTTGQNRLDSLMPDTAIALPNAPGGFMVNTNEKLVERLGASSRFVMTFDTPVAPADLGTPPYDLYWLRNDGTGFVDIHLPGNDSLADLHVGYPAETGPTAFLDDLGFPWMVEVPFNWRFPLESVAIEDAYPRFLDWAASHGTEDTDWYDHPVESQVSLPVGDYLIERDWTIDIPSS